MTPRRRPPAPELMEDAAAIARLEAEIIPWQSGRDGAPSRRLREEPTAHPLVAAEGVLRRGARPGAPGPGEERRLGTGGNPVLPTHADLAAKQGQQLLRWATRHGRLIDRRLEERLVNLGGVEHEVFLDDATGRWLKLTMPGKAGKELHARDVGGFGTRPTLVTEDALPASYLRRLVLANTRLGDDYWLHGIMDGPSGPRIVVSQRDIDGEPASPGEIARHFVTAGFAQVNAKTFFQPARNLLVSDAHTANVFRTPVGVAPFDVCVQQPEGVLRRAVEPAAALNFDVWEEEQSGLGF